MKTKQKIIIASIAFGAISALFLGGVLLPVLGGVLKDREELLSHEREFYQLKEDSKNSRDFAMLQSRYSEELEQIYDLLVDSETPIVFFRFLDEAAALFNLRIEKTPGAVQRLQEDRWPSFEVRVAGEGSYPDVMAFLQKVENSPYLLDIKTLSASSRRGIAAEQGQAAISFSLTMRVFSK